VEKLKKWSKNEMKTRMTKKVAVIGTCMSLMLLSSYTSAVRDSNALAFVGSFIV
jgi:hypothetical protein